MIVDFKKRSTRGVRGLRDDFNPDFPYSVSANPVERAIASALWNNTSAVGTYNGMPVYKHELTGKLYVWNQGNQDPDFGILMYQLIPTELPTSPNTPQMYDSGGCPCEGCVEEIQQETWYASKTQSSSSDIPVNMTSERVVCDPTSDNPTIACQDELLRVKQQLGINGLRGLGNVATKYPAWAACSKHCNDNFHGADLTRCYKECEKYIGWGANPTNGGGRLMVDSGGGLVSFANSQPALSGLGNEVLTDTSSTGTVYTTDPYAPNYLPPSINCESGNSNVLWFVIVGVAGILAGILFNVAWKKR